MKVKCENPLCNTIIDDDEADHVFEAIDHNQGMIFCCDKCAGKLWLTEDFAVEQVLDVEEKAAILYENGLHKLEGIDANDDIYVQRYHDVGGEDIGTIRHIYVRCGMGSFLQIK